MNLKGENRALKREHCWAESNIEQGAGQKGHCAVAAWRGALGSEAAAWELIDEPGQNA